MTVRLEMYREDPMETDAYAQSAVETLPKLFHHKKTTCLTGRWTTRSSLFTRVYSSSLPEHLHDLGRCADNRDGNTVQRFDLLEDTVSDGHDPEALDVECQSEVTRQGLLS